jgi:PD-(D/E)XK endonuclease
MPALGPARRILAPCHNFVQIPAARGPRSYAAPMAPLKQKGDLAELMVAADLRRRGHRIALPYGEDWDYDLIIDRRGRLERIQVKYCASDGAVIPVKCYSHSLTNGRIRATKLYTAATVDWIAVWDATTSTTYYVPSSVFDGHKQLHLRLAPARNSQRLGIRNARDFLEI